jgi:chemotaxis protein methyltransferase CheR
VLDETGAPLLTKREFVALQALIYREAGIQLGEHKMALVTGRLTRRVRELGLRSFGDYHDLALHDRDELTRLLDRITTNETQFFREPQHFSFLAERVFPRWRRDAEEGRRPRRVHIWSAACSTGEEPYSLAMLLREHFPEAGWSLEVLATDLSTQALDRARAAVWPTEKARGIPRTLLTRYMLRGRNDQAGHVRVAPEVRSLVRFEHLNLNDASYANVGSFDLIFCRNVLIYFSAASKAGVIHRLLRHLEPDGFLFIGHAETLNGVSSEVRCVTPTVYARQARGHTG